MGCVVTGTSIQEEVKALSGGKHCLGKHKRRGKERKRRKFRELSGEARAAYGGAHHFSEVISNPEGLGGERG